MMIYRLRRSAALLVSVAVVAAACSGSATSSAEPTDLVEAFNAQAANGIPDAESDANTSERRLFAGVNIAIADVDLADIIFDTFDGGSLPLSTATEEQVLRLLNAIPPINEPAYQEASQAEWLDDDDLVLGFVADDGTAWAHPHRILNFHEIVNTSFAGQPVAITYCPLCGSGLVFDRRPNDLRHDGVLTFDNTSALYENDMVMVDQETNTYWWQVSGSGIVGNLTGTKLTLLPSMTTSWKSWTELHPQTMVLSNNQGRGPSYERDPFATYGDRVNQGDTPFPISQEAFADDRLQPSTRVIGFESDGAPAAVAVLANELTVVPAGDGQVVLLDGQGGGGLFGTNVDGESASFVVQGDAFVDSVTGSRWNPAGRAIAGPAAGRQLSALPSRSAYWFAWVSTLDGERTQLFTPAG